MFYDTWNVINYIEFKLDLQLSLNVNLSATRYDCQPIQTIYYVQYPLNTLFIAHNICLPIKKVFNQGYAETQLLWFKVFQFIGYRAVQIWSNMILWYCIIGTRGRLKEETMTLTLH